MNRPDTHRLKAHAARRGGLIVNSWSGVVLATARLWEAIKGDPGRCPECLWITADWGHNPDCPLRTRHRTT